jgi:flagellar basal-body rod modification protein FlgD
LQIAAFDFLSGDGQLAEAGNMITQPVSQGVSGTQIKSKSFELKTEDFIKMMITQLQNQDPLEPAKNQDLLAQMSQIGQLQSSTTLQQSLKGLVLQNSLGAAGNLIGKMVQGMDEQNETVKGIVTSIRVDQDQVYLELDNGQSLPLGRVTTIWGEGGLPAIAANVAA